MDCTDSIKCLLCHRMFHVSRRIIRRHKRRFLYEFNETLFIHHHHKLKKTRPSLLQQSWAVPSAKIWHSANERTTSSTRSCTCSSTTGRWSNIGKCSRATTLDSPTSRCVGLLRQWFRFLYVQWLGKCSESDGAQLSVLSQLWSSHWLSSTFRSPRDRYRRNSGVQWIQ